MRYRTLLATMVLGVAVSFGPAVAGGPGGGSAGRGFLRKGALRACPGPGVGV